MTWIPTLSSQYTGSLSETNRKVERVAELVQPQVQLHLFHHHIQIHQTGSTNHCNSTHPNSQKLDTCYHAQPSSTQEQQERRIRWETECERAPSAAYQDEQGAYDEGSFGLATGVGQEEDCQAKVSNRLVVLRFRAV
jgi:hypothetical protein